MAALAGLQACATPEPMSEPVLPTAPESVIQYQVFELTFVLEGTYDNPFTDVTIDVEFTSPSGERYEVGGFFYGTEDAPEIVITEDLGEDKFGDYVYDILDTWKVRFAPREPGLWDYTYSLSDVGGMAADGTGTFVCRGNPDPLDQPIMQNPQNPFRWIFADGTPFYPIGVQDCGTDHTASGSILDSASIDGPFRLDRDLPLPEGPEFVRSPGLGPINADMYFRRFRDAGFNFYRFSQENCSLGLVEKWDVYRIHEAKMMDELLQYLNKYDFKIMYGLLGYLKAFNTRTNDGEDFDKVRRFIKYSVDRWGAYVDIWQLTNEQRSSRFWINTMSAYIHEVDPHRRPVTTSWEQPELDGIDINTPHWYHGGDELLSDIDTATRAAVWKSHGKPVIVAEHGNYVDPETFRNGNAGPGVGGTWDPDSGTRMRIRTWTAFFSEISFVFWHTGYARDGHFMNIWLGPEERQYIRSLASFTDHFGPDTTVEPGDVSSKESVRAYVLSSSEAVGAYLHHHADHETPVLGCEVVVNVLTDATAYWYEPATATVVDTIPVTPGRRLLTAPPFAVDIALLITAGPPPDVDRDGIATIDDPDNDNDGVPDVDDAFPLEPWEWSDADGDGIGDVMDADDDGDGIGDDENRNGTPDHEEMDFDGDGVPRGRTAVWDAFPFDPAEWADSDGDGIGDNSDS